MNYDYVLGIENDNIKKLLQTKQFALSEKIWDKRIDLGFSIEEMAFKLNMSVEDYFKYEYADINLSIEDYKIILNSINALEFKKKTTLDGKHLKNLMKKHIKKGECI